MSVKLQYLLSFVPLLNVVPIFFWVMLSLKKDLGTRKEAKTVFISVIPAAVLVVLNIVIGLIFESPTVSAISNVATVYLSLALMSLTFAHSWARERG